MWLDCSVLWLGLLVYTQTRTSIQSLGCDSGMTVFKNEVWGHLLVYTDLLGYRNFNSESNLVKDIISISVKPGLCPTIPSQMA